MSMYGQTAMTVPDPRQLGQYWNLRRSVTSEFVNMSQQSVWKTCRHISRQTLSPWWKFSMHMVQESSAPS
eukprot:9584044-Lingulodinium_polyedra.AAC.1